MIGKIADYALNSTKDNSNKKSIKELQHAAKKQELQMQMAEAQARVAQEIAIAKRIEIAEEVEIEGFYDLNANGDVGIKANDQAVSLGASASGRKITKRIYKFTGVHSALITLEKKPKKNLKLSRLQCFRIYITKQTRNLHDPTTITSRQTPPQ